MKPETKKRQLEFSLEAAWSRRNGDDVDNPDPWGHGEVLQIGDEIDVYAAYQCNVDGDIEIGGRFADDPDAIEVWAFEDALNGEVFFVDCPHNQRPPTPDDLVTYLLENS